MAILLGILKVIGIVILAVIGVVLAAFCYLLFLPVHLKLYAANDKEWMFRLKLLGFLRFFQIRAEYLSGELIWSVRAFWGRVIVFPREEKEQGQKQAGQKPEQKQDWDQKQQREQKQKQDQKQGQEQKREQDRKQGQEQKQEQEQKREQDQKQGQVQNRERKNAPPEKQAVKRERGESVSVGEKFQSFRLRRLTPAEKRAIGFLWQELIWYLRKIKPTLAEADALYSLGDPAWTGEFTGILSLWPSAYGKKIQFCPDFESDDPYFQGYIQLESKFYAIHLVKVLLRVYFNKDCKKLFDL